MVELGPETYTGQAVQLLESCLADSGIPRDKLLGIGVTLPGPVDYRTGVVQQLCRAPRWQQFPIAQRLQQAFGCQVVVDKDVYAVLALLAQTGELPNTQNCAYLSICEGIGSALMINGQVFRGSHSLAGEIGHLTVRKDGIPCPCGNNGCLELYCSDIGIMQQYHGRVLSVTHPEKGKMRIALQEGITDKRAPVEKAIGENAPLSESTGSDGACASEYLHGLMRPLR